jgi:hypothetical protein
VVVLQGDSVLYYWCAPIYHCKVLRIRGSAAHFPCVPSLHPNTLKRENIVFMEVQLLLMAETADRPAYFQRSTNSSRTDVPLSELCLSLWTSLHSSFYEFPTHYHYPAEVHDHSISIPPRICLWTIGPQWMGLCSPMARRMPNRVS